MDKIKKPRIVIAAPHSGSGKTTITLSIMKLLVDEGYKVQGFKVGPDYIDTSYYYGITNRPGRNLDTWMTSKNLMKEFFQRGSETADISVIEGVMGLFDGLKGDADIGSTAQIAKELFAPVILVVDAKSQARSVAALLHGFYHFDPEVNLRGVIFNKVGSKNHFTYLKEAVDSSGLPVEIIGYIPRQEELVLPERHLGLVPYIESGDEKSDQDMEAFFNTLSDISSKYLDKDKILNIANSANSWARKQPEFFVPMINLKAKKIAIAVALDKAFSFYYQENLEWLEEQGVKLIYTSPMKDKKLPGEAKSIYIGGGYPELFARELSENIDFLESLYNFYLQGFPILGECGGLMYLCKTLINHQGEGYEMAGIVPAKIEMKENLKALGYREGRSILDSFFLKRGESVRGHEFRYSEMFPEQEESFPWAYELSGRFGTRLEGYNKDNVLASYLHTHFGSNPLAGKRWIQAALNV